MGARLLHRELLPLRSLSPMPMHEFLECQYRVVSFGLGRSP